MEQSLSKRIPDFVLIFHTVDCDFVCVQGCVGGGRTTKPKKTGDKSGIRELIRLQGYLGSANHLIPSFTAGRRGSSDEWYFTAPLLRLGHVHQILSINLLISIFIELRVEAQGCRPQ